MAPASEVGDSRPPRAAAPRFARASRALLLLPVLAASVEPSLAQYFGRNKVQWERFPFHRIESAHFDIYFYPADNPTAPDVARMAERWYERLSRVLGHSFTSRKPLILYADPPDFQQTTVVGGLIGEGVGGLTEPLRHRVVLPLAASYASTDHVLGHEIVHVFQFDMAQAGAPPGRAGSLADLPLWLVEGLAEYLSLGPDSPITSLWLRDALSRDDLPTFKKLSGDPRFFPYRFGHAFWAYVGGRYGDATVASLYREATRLGPARAIEAVLGRSADEVFREWAEAIRQAYGPVVLSRQAVPPGAEPLLGRPSRAGRVLDLAPSISPDGTQVAFLSSRDLFSVDLYLADARSKRVGPRLLSAAKDPHLEAIRFLDSAGSWSPDGRRLALVAAARGDDRILLLDVGKRRVAEALRIPGVGAIRDPAFSPDGRAIVFSGSVSGVSDLYLFDLERRAVQKLTSDRSADFQPAWSPDGRTIAFVSDRGPETSFAELRFAPLGIWLLDLASGETKQVRLFPRATHINPQFSPDGRTLYFIADPDGIPDLFRVSLETGEIRRISRVVTGVSGITESSPAFSVARKTGAIAFSIFGNGGTEVYWLDPEHLAGEPVADLEPPRSAAALPPGSPPAGSIVASYLENPAQGLPAEAPVSARPYRPSLELAFVGPPTIGIATGSLGTAFGGGVSAAFTDVLGGHQLGVALEGGSSTEFGNTIAVQATYLNRTRRLNWGAAAARVPFLTTFATVSREPAATVIRQVFEQVVVEQAGGLAQYPLSSRRRFELSAFVTRYDIEAEGVELVLGDNGQVIERSFAVDSPPSLDLLDASVGFVGDSSSFGFTSPLRGARFRFELGATGGSLRYRTGLADVRRYLFRRPVGFAFRGLFLGRFGEDAEDERLAPLFVGRETLVRGYRAGSFRASECTAEPGSADCPEFDRLLGSRIGVANFEVRLPLLGSEQLGLVRAPRFPLELAAFVDGGVAWTRQSKPTLKFARRSAQRIPVFSYGIATRFLLGFVPIELYYAVPLERPQKSRVFGFLFAPGW
jgi:hypothetical protein